MDFHQQQQQQQQHLQKQQSNPQQHSSVAPLPMHQQQQQAASQPSQPEAQYGSIYVGDDDSQQQAHSFNNGQGFSHMDVDEGDGAGEEEYDLQLLARPERLAPDGVTDLGLIPDDPMDGNDSNRTTWLEVDRALQPIDTGAHAKQCDRCGKWRYVQPISTASAQPTKFCVPTGGVSAEAMLKEQARLTAVARAAAAASDPDAAAALEGEESGHAFDPARVAKLMGTHVANKYAPQHHSSDSSSEDEDADEGTRAEKRRRRVLKASRKRIKAAAQEAQALSEKIIPQFPRAVIEWECSMNPDPSFNSCAHPQETIQPTHTVLKYRNLKPAAPWNFATLGLGVITDEIYKRFYRDASGEWNKYETLVLLDRVKQFGLFDQSWAQIMADPLLKIRHPTIEDVQQRFFEILALASVYGQSLTSPFAKRRLQAMWDEYHAAQMRHSNAVAMNQYAQQAVNDALAAQYQLASARQNHIVMHQQLMRQNQHTPSKSLQQQQRNNNNSASDRSGARARGSGTRLSSRLQTKKQTRYTYSDEDDDFILDEDSDSKPAKRPSRAAPVPSSSSQPPASLIPAINPGAAASNNGGDADDDEGFVLLWKIEKILACRHRRVLKGHEESSADESEVEATIVDSTANTHRKHHLQQTQHTQQEKKTISGIPTEQNSAAAAAPSSSEEKSNENVAMDTTESAAAASPSAAAASSASGDVEMKVEGSVAPSPSPAAASSSSTPAPSASPSPDQPREFVSYRRSRHGQAHPSASITNAVAIAQRHLPVSDADPNYTIIPEYLVKIEGQSYLHLEWHTLAGLKRKFGTQARIQQRITTFHANQAEMEATNLDRYAGEPFDPRFTEVDRIIASNMVDVVEEPEERAVREQKNREEMEKYTSELTARQQRVSELEATDPAAAVALQRQHMANPVPIPTPIPEPPIKRTEMFLVKWMGLSYSQCTWETREDVDDEPKIAQYRRYNKMPSRSELTAQPSYSQQEFDARRNHWYTESPPFKTKNQLRDYQIEGVNFLIKAWYDDRNTILADEMGLGKTVQCVALFEHLKRVEHINGPFLVVVPLGTITHWKREFENWTDFNTLIYHDAVRGKETRRLIRETEWYYGDTKQIKFNVMITTYEVLIADVEEMSTVNWMQVIVDEGHRIKNKSSKILEALQMLNCNRRLLLTGTPVQNNTVELFTLLNFLEPDVFSNIAVFEEHFGVLQGGEQVHQLQERIRPYVLRRMKEGVEKSIPPKEETIVECELTMIQLTWYRAIYDRNMQFLRQGTNPKNMPKLLNVEMELRKCCNHPWLIAGAEDKEVPAHASDTEYMKKTIDASGKMVLLSKLLPKLKADGHRVLIFSQMIQILDIIQEYCEFMNWQYERLDGAIRGTEREAAIDRFSKPDSNRFIFLLSTRAGGVGITLTSADTVIIFDSDWNPQQDNQAMARAHRIGQKRKVTIFRLITRNTYETEMFLRSSKKLGLDHALLTNLERGRGALEDDEKDDINKLLKLGAYGVFSKETDEKAKEFQNDTIDNILKNRTTVIKVKEKVQGEDGEDGTNEDGTSATASTSAARQSTAALTQSRMNLSKMTFDSNAPDMPSLNDPRFWEKIRPVEDAFKYTPDQLLSELTGGTAYESEDKKSEFFRFLTLVTERMLKAKREGDNDSAENVDGLVKLLIQFTATPAFSVAQRAAASKWLSEAEKRIERRARIGRTPLTANMSVSRGRAAPRQRGTIAGIGADKDAYGDDDDEDEPRPKKKKGGKFSNFGGSSSEGEEDSDGSDFAGDHGGRAGGGSSGSDDGDGEVDEHGKLIRRPSRGRPGQRSGKRRKGLLNLDICEKCHKSGKLIACDGMCQAWYHLECAGLTAPPPEDQEWQCVRCTTKRHKCHACHEEGVACEPGSEVAGGVNKCSISTCGRFYHIECIKKYPITYFYENSNRFRCALHYCAACAVPGDSQSMIHCTACPIGLHIRCITGGEIRLAKKTMYCAACVILVRDTKEGQEAIAAADVSNWEEPYREKKKPLSGKVKPNNGKTRQRRVRSDKNKPKGPRSKKGGAVQTTLVGGANVASKPAAAAESSSAPVAAPRQYRAGEYFLRFKLDDAIVFRTEEKQRFFDVHIEPRIKVKYPSVKKESDDESEIESEYESEEDEDMEPKVKTEGDAAGAAGASPKKPRPLHGGKEPVSKIVQSADGKPVPAAASAPRPRSLLEARTQAPSDAASLPTASAGAAASPSESPTAPSESGEPSAAEKPTSGSGKKKPQVAIKMKGKPGQHVVKPTPGIEPGKGYAFAPKVEKFAVGSTQPKSKKEKAAAAAEPTVAVAASAATAAPPQTVVTMDAQQYEQMMAQQQQQQQQHPIQYHQQMQPVQVPMHTVQIMHPVQSMPQIIQVVGAEDPSRKRAREEAQAQQPQAQPFDPYGAAAAVPQGYIQAHPQAQPIYTTGYVQQMAPTQYIIQHPPQQVVMQPQLMDHNTYMQHQQHQQQMQQHHYQQQAQQQQAQYQQQMVAHQHQQMQMQQQQMQQMQQPTLQEDPANKKQRLQ